MYKIYSKRFILDINTGTCHDLEHKDERCKIDKIKFEHIFMADSLNNEIKRHPAYKKKCTFCMIKADYD